MINASKVTLSYNKQVIFDGISFIINSDDRIGLVGRNGSGKTTLLKAINDPSFLNDGVITVQSKKKLAYMPQEVVLDSNLSVLEETFSGFTELYALLKEEKELEPLLKDASNHDAAERYAAVHEELSAYSPEVLKAKTKKILMGLGFSVKQLEEPVSKFSVGWKMRIVLAKLLLQEADFYLFDEPTNHLDLQAKEWFLEFLKESTFGFMIICHEKYFLDELCEKIVEIEFGKAKWYPGNYSYYEVQKVHDYKILESQYTLQQKEIKEKKETIARFKASASKAPMARSMQKALDKLELIVLPPSPKIGHFSFPPVDPSGKLVLKAENLSQTFGDKTIFKNVSLEINRGQKVALIAPNGVGKTTLFNLLAKLLPLQTGTLEIGYNVNYAIFNQDQNKALDMNRTVLDNINQICPKAQEQKVRSFLGSFLFSGSDVMKKVGVLSGGEKNKVGMVGVLLQHANLLLLDEPTNHLDIPSKEILLKALQDYDGTLVFVSHDRDFINDLATDIIELTAKGAYHYQGNYDSYLYQKQDVIEYQDDAEPKQPKKQNDKSADKPAEKVNPQKQLKMLEDKIAKFTTQIAETNELFAELDYGTKEFDTALAKIEKLQKDLKDAEAQWEILTAQTK